MQAIIFKCPHCQTTVEVLPDLINERVVCPNPACGEPFSLEVPRGTVVDAHDAAEGQRAQYSLDGQDIHAERTLHKIHPAVFRRHPFQTLGIVILVLLGALLLLDVFERWEVPSPAWLGLAMLAGGAIWAGLLMFEKVFTTLTITTRRSMVRRGLVARSTSEVQHANVRNLQVRQSFTDRLLLVGDLAISSAAQDDMEIDVRGISRPQQIADVVRAHQRPVSED